MNIMNIMNIDDNISPGWEKNEITPKSYGIGQVAKLLPQLTPRSDIPSLTEHVLPFHVFTLW